MPETMLAAAILAGGKGTRIRALTGTTPKVLLPVEGRPFLAHLLEYLAEQQVGRAVLCTGHAAEAVMDAARTHAPESFEVLESREPEPLGTGGAVKRALGELGETFFIVNGDTYLQASFAALLNRHREREAVITLSLVRFEHAAEKGTVRVSPEGNVIDFTEKVEDGTGLINGGVYVAEARLFDRCPETGPCSLERWVIPEALRVGERVAANIVDAPFVDIGLPEDYLRVRDRLPRSRR